MRGQRGGDLALEVVDEIRSGVCALAFGAVRDAARELGLEMAGVEPRERGGDDFGAFGLFHDRRHINAAVSASALRSLCYAGVGRLSMSRRLRNSSSS